MSGGNKLWWPVRLEPRRARREGELSPRQLQVVDRLAHGGSYADVAEALDIEQNTVKTHIHTVIKMWGAGTRTGLIGEAFRRGYLVRRRCEPIGVTSRQAEVLTLLSFGEHIDAIAEELGVSNIAVKYSLRGGMATLGARDTPHAVTLWMVRGAVAAQAPRSIEVTELQRRVIELIAAGLDRAEIAEKTGASMAQTHLRIGRLYKRAKVADDLALIGWSYRHGVLAPAGRSSADLPDLAAPVLKLMAEGLGVARIARRLGKDDRLVWELLNTARSAFGVRSRLALVVAAYDAGVLVPGAEA